MGSLSFAERIPLANISRLFQQIEQESGNFRNLVSVLSTGDVDGGLILNLGT
jgi:hypothetical protein